MKPRRVLVVSSYHAGFEWSDEILSAIRRDLVASGLPVELSVEYLDAKRGSLEAIEPLVVELMAAKYGHSRFDAMICEDNAALELMLEYRDELFPDVPIVFCGVNGFSPELVSGQESVTGVVEDVNVRGTVELAMQLLPSTNTMAVISDTTGTSRLNLQRVRTEAGELGVELIELAELDRATLRARLRELPPNTALLYLDFYRTPAGEQLTLDEGLHEVMSSRPDLQVFSLWEDKIHRGVLGGVVTTAAGQGEHAATKVIRILEGEKASAIPIDTTSPWSTIVNYPVLRRFGIDTARIPQDAMVRGRPPGFFERYGTVVVASLAVAVIAGVIISLLVVIIVHRRRAEAALRSSESRFRAVVEAAPMAIMMVRQEAYVYANPAATRLLGYDDPDDVVGLRVLDVLAPEYHQEARSRIERLDEGGDNPSKELGLIRANGERRWTISTSVSVEVDGQPTAIVVAQDVTERRQAERALQEANLRLQEAIAGGQVGLWDWDLAEDTVFYSTEWKQQLGFEDSEISSDFEEWRGRVHPDDLAATLESVQRMIEGRRQNDTVEFRMRHRDGTYRWILARASVVMNDKGEPVRVLGSHLDITERVELEGQLRQAQKMEAIGRLAGGVAHDFNNMLAAILGFTELSLRQVNPGERLHGYLQQIEQAASRSADLTRQLLAFSRQQTVRPEVLDLNATVEPMLDMLHRLIGENVALEWRPAPSVWPVRIDPSQVDQVLANLCLNARDAIDGAGRIMISTANVCLDGEDCKESDDLLPGEYVEIAVADSGCGMNAETLSHVFEPFFTTKGLGQGTGLGLATIYGIATQNNGAVTVESAVGEGSTFRIFLPRHVGDDRVVHAGPDGDRITSDGSGTILVVEDEPLLLDICRESLELLGYHVLVAQTPGEALERVKEQGHEIALLLTDVVMPESTGGELFARINADFPQIKVLYMSGYPDDQLEPYGVLSEATQFIQKPFSTEELSRKIHSILDNESS